MGGKGLRSYRNRHAAGEGEFLEFLNSICALFGIDGDRLPIPRTCTSRSRLLAPRTFSCCVNTAALEAAHGFLMGSRIVQFEFLSTSFATPVLQLRCKALIERWNSTVACTIRRAETPRAMYTARYSALWIFRGHTAGYTNCGDNSCTTSTGVTTLGISPTLV